MEDRIKIGDVWYVREGSQPSLSKPPLTFEDITKSENIIYETNSYSWEAQKIYKTEEEIYPGIAIEVTDKIGNRTEYWDNHDYFLEILKGDEEALEELKSNLPPKDMEDFLNFLRYLQEIGWL